MSATLSRLPDLSLPSASGAPVGLRARGREGSVILLLHSATCVPCLDYVRGLGQVQEGLRDWDGRVVVVTPGAPDAAATVAQATATPFLVAADPEGTCAGRCRLQGGGMIIADQWGEVFHVEPGGTDRHDTPAPSEVVEWLRYVAIQCPECQGEAL
jgi:peroxiredoxin